MAITTVDGLISALGNNRQKIPFTKTANLGTQTVGQNGSFWRIAGVPGAGAIPTNAATCNNTTLGGLNYTNPTGGQKTYIGKVAAAAGGTSSFEIHDRLAHMGGLSTVIATAQTVGISLSTLASTDNISGRIGAADYSAVQWWLEWYVASGATGVTATVNFTDQTGVARTTTVTVPASMAAGRMLAIIPSTAGQYIRSVESVTLSATTGTAGNFGVTATLQRTEFFVNAANQQVIMDWAQTGFAAINDSSCLFFVGLANNVTIQAPSGAITLVQG